MQDPVTKIDLKCLSAADIPAFLDLYEKLDDIKKPFLKPRSAEDLLSHLEAGMPLMGVYRNDILAAGALLTYPDPEYAAHTRHLEGYPLTPETAALQGVVSTEKGLFTTLVAFAKDLAATRGYSTLLAKVHDQNEGARSAFDKRGFQVFLTALDPQGGYKAHFFRAVTGGGATDAAVPLPQPAVGPLPPAPDLPGNLCQTEEPRPGW